MLRLYSHNNIIACNYHFSGDIFELKQPGKELLLFKPQMLSSDTLTPSRGLTIDKRLKTIQVPSKSLGIPREFHYNAPYNNYKHGLISGFVNPGTKYLVAYGLT